MKYTPSTPLGGSWAGYVEVDQAYDWDPVSVDPAIEEASVVGLEAPLWTETIRTLSDVEYMALPRLAGHAEIGWSAADRRSWTEYRVRLGHHGSRLAAMGVRFYRSPQVPWQ
jgi:hexosaminidase